MGSFFVEKANFLDDESYSCVRVWSHAEGGHWRNKVTSEGSGWSDKRNGGTPDRSRNEEKRAVTPNEIISSDLS